MISQAEGFHFTDGLGVLFVVFCKIIVGLDVLTDNRCKEKTKNGIEKVRKKIPPDLVTCKTINLILAFSKYSKANSIDFFFVICWSIRASERVYRIEILSVTTLMTALG